MKTFCRLKGVHSLNAPFIIALLFTAFAPLAALRAQPNYATPYTFKTVAGSGGISSSTNGTGPAASFLNPSTVAVDGSGNLYVTDTGNNLIRKITPSGVVTILAGSVGSIGSADGIGSAATFSSPQGIAIDSSGNVYVADGGYTVRKITPAGVVTTLAGEAEIIGSSPGYSAPLAIAADGAGNVYVADNQNSVVRKISPLGVVTILAGTVGVYGSDDGTGADASFYAPQGITVDSSGNVYVADTVNATIRKITPAGVVTTLAGNVYVRGNVDGTGTGAQFNYPMGLTADPAGNIYVADGMPWGGQTSTIRKVTPAGVVTTLAGGPVGYADGLGTAAKFSVLLGVAADSAGNVYVADSGNQMVRRITSGGTVTTFVGGGGTPGFVNGQGGVARFHRPGGVAMDNEGNVMITDMNNHAIRRMTPAGVVTTAKVGSEYFFASTPGLAVDGAGNSYSVYGGCQIAKTTPLGVFTIFAGIGYTGSADGPGQYASFSYPQGLAVDVVGNVYVADSQNSTIRKISITGEVSTLAGLAGNSGSDDGTGSAARFSYPLGVALDVAGNLYVTDSFSATVRRITPAGVVTTLAGLAENPGNTDGTGSAARFMGPTAIAVDAAGNVFVTDVIAHTIRKITPAGVVTTLGGQTGYADFSTGVGPAAHFPNPTGIAVDGLGQIYVADSGYNSILVGGVVASPSITGQPTGQSVIETQPVTFSVTATGGLLSYQWRRGGVALPGANSPTLTLDSSAIADAGSYDVVITNPQGAVTSSAVTLTVTAIPVITSLSPVRQVLTPGQNLSLVVTATGTGPLAYQWFHNGTLLAGATASTYAVTGVTTQNSGWYRVTVTDNIGTRSSAALFVAVAPAVTQVRAWGSYYQAQVDVPNNLTDAIAISSSGSHALALRSSGTVVAWGNNSSGQTNVPGGLTGVVAVSAGGGASLALKGDGTVVAWGGNSENQTDIPAGLSGVVAISAGFRHCLALKGDGTVVAWGDGWYGETAVPAGLSGVVAISAGMSHSTVLKNDGTVVVWGEGTYGEKNIPNGLSGVTTISSEGYHTLALKNDGTVVAWGSNSNGESSVPSGLSGVIGVANSAFVSFAVKSDGTVVGWGDNFDGRATPPADLANVVSVSKELALRDGTADALPVLTTQPLGQVKLEGQNVSFTVAATGVGPLSYQWRKDGVNITGATTTTLALTNLLPGNAGNYDVLVSNYLGATTSAAAVLAVISPPIITSLSPARQVIGPGQSLNLSVTATGTGSLSYQWIHNGRPLAGAVGTGIAVASVSAQDGGWYVVLITDSIGTRRSQPIFVTVAPTVTQVRGWGNGIANRTSVPAGLNNAVALSAASFALALKSDGTVVVLGGTVNSPSFTPPVGLSNVVSVSAGNGHMLALKSDSTVVAWGYDNYGETHVPAGLVDVVAIAASNGGGFSLALKSNGTVVAWGNNNHGLTNVPVGLTNVVAICVGSDHALALKADGTVVAWGYNNFGQTNVPAGLTSVVAISAGPTHSVALKADGTVVAWGQNYFGQTTLPGGLAGVVGIDVGDDFTLALKNDGTVVGWGEIGNGEGAVPNDLTKILSVTAGNYYSLILRDASTDTAPMIAVQPVGLTRSETQTAAFSVTAAGVGPFTYQWRKNGATISGATAPTYNLNALIPSDAAQYSVVVTNHIGATVSANATLTVNPLPVITSLSQTRQVINPGYGLNLSVTATGTGTLSYQWIHNGIPINAATGNEYSVANVASQHGGWYAVSITDSNGTRRSTPIFVAVAPTVTQVRGWGFSGTQALTGLPAGLTDVIAIDAGPQHVLAVKRDGTLIGWGYDFNGNTHSPAGLSNVVAVSAGSTHSLALKSDGTVVAWGQNANNQASVPAGLNEVVAIAAGNYYSLALKSDGTVVAWGNEGYGSSQIPAGLSGVVAIAAGYQTPLALKNDGTALSWGTYGNTVPNNMTNLRAISVDTVNASIVGLKNDGTVIDAPFAQWKAPVGLTGVVAISTGNEHVLALKNDGSVVGWGHVANGAATPPADLAKVLAISAGISYSMALCDATPVSVPVISTQPLSQSIGVDGSVTFTVAAAGYPIPIFQWQRNGVNISGATGSSYTIAHVAASDAGSYTVAAMNSVGSVTSSAAILTTFIAAPSDAVITFTVE